MSDKNTYNKDFVNQGWKNMSSVLYKEMPVEKKKRRFLFWIFVTGIIACGATMCFGLYSNNSNHITSDKIEVATLNKIKEHSSIQTDIYSTTKSNIIENNSIVEEGIKEANKVDERPEIKEANSFVGKKEIAKGINSNEKENNSTSQFYNLNYNIQTLRNNESLGHLFFNENMNKKETTIIEIKEEGIETLKAGDKHESKIIPSISNEGNPINEEIEEIEKVNILKPIAFSDIDYIEFLERKTLPFNPKFGYWEFGIEAGFVFQNKNELGGKLGFVATKMFRPKWSLHTGLEYNAQFMNYSVAEQDDSSFMDTGGVTTGVDPVENELITLQSSPTKINSHIIKIPILVGYKFNRSFEISAGVIGSSQIYSGKRASTDYLSSTFPLNDMNITSKKITPLLDIQASIGMTYYPNKKWGINLRYDNGFLQRKIKYSGSTTSDLGLSIKGYNSRNRQLSLSARMYF